MKDRCHGEFMIDVLFLVFLLLLGPLAYVYGKDTRTGDARGGWPGEPRRQPGHGARLPPVKAALIREIGANPEPDEVDPPSRDSGRALVEIHVVPLNPIDIAL